MVDLPWYVIAFSAVGINIPPGRDEYHGRLHSLWYGEIQEKGVYRWFEAGFMVSAIIPRRMTHVPAAMEPGENAGKALANAAYAGTSRREDPGAQEAGRRSDLKEDRDASQEA